MTRDLGLLVDDEAKNIRACSYPNPGYTAEQIQTRLDKLISPKDDVTVILAGTNNVPRNSVATCINRMDDLITEAKLLTPKCDIIVCEIPNRYDVSCMNQIREINLYLEHVCSKSKNFHLLKNDFNRSDFGRDGLHFSDNGKCKIAESIKSMVQKLSR